jgi:hypothetical protein
MRRIRQLCLTASAAFLLLPAVTSQAATTTGNLFVVPSGGSSSCARSATAVDFSSASSGAKCASIQAAVSAASGGDTVIVKSGTYSNASISNVTKSPAVRVVVEPGGTANIGGTTWVGANGITLDGTEGANGQGFSTSGGFTVGSNGGAAVKNFTIDGALIHDAGGGATVYMTGCDNVKIAHLEIKNVSNADGIQMANFTNQPWCTNVTFDHINMHDFNATCGVDHQDGVQIRSGANITFTNSKITKLNNCGSQGFFANQEGDLGGNNTTLSNTVIAGINGNAINFSSKPPQRMINNTIDGGLNTCQPVTSTCTGVIMKNNILNTSCAGEKIFHDRVQNSGDWANNVSTSNCGYGSQGDTVTPNFGAMFVSAGSPTYDYHLVSGAYAIGKASVSDYTATDMDGGARDMAPDAGADEYGATSGGGTTPTPPPSQSPDTTAPTTTISAAPSGSTTSTYASFTFSGSDETTAASSLNFECAMDGGYTPCTSPKGYSGLGVGQHTFTVRAIDAAGNVDATPASATWTITAAAPSDTTAPDTTISSGPSGSTTSTYATFGFSGSDDTTAAGSLTYECSVDGGYASCASPKGYSGLGVGSHTFSVRAKDAAGNVDGSPATRTWTVTSSSPTTPPPSTPPPTTDPQPPAQPSGGLVAAYGFEDTDATGVKDSSGNGLNGTRTSSTTSTPNGKFGKAFTFDGSSSLVSVADNAKLHLTKGMTVEAWVWPTVLSGWTSVVMREQPRELAYGLYANTDNSKPGGYGFVSSEVDARGGAHLPLQTWSHLATTYDGANLKLFVNGTEVASRPMTGSMTTVAGALRIGGNRVWSEFFKGRIDEVRVYDRALSAAELKTDMGKAVG